MNDVAAMALMADDSPTLLKGKPGGDKRVAWGEPIPLAEVKAIGKALGGSVNDVLLASVAGAIGAWLREQGDDPAGKEIRAMVPVNLRPLDQAWQLGNRFGLAPLVLPIGIDNPVGRLERVAANMRGLAAGANPGQPFGRFGPMFDLPPCPSLPEEGLTALAKAMVKDGYPRPFIASVVGAAAATDILIPPSINMIIYGALTDTSVPKLLRPGAPAYPSRGSEKMSSMLASRLKWL